MTKVKDIIDGIVSKLQAIPQLVALMESANASNIAAYHDQWPQKTDLLESVRQMQPGRILVAHQSSGPGNLGRLEWWRHTFTIYLKPIGYMSDAWYWMINGVPTNGDGLSMLHTESIASGLQRMEIPSIQRKFIAADASNPYFLVDYFEITLTFGEGNK